MIIYFKPGIPPSHPEIRALCELLHHQFKAQYHLLEAPLATPRTELYISQAEALSKDALIAFKTIDMICDPKAAFLILGRHQDSDPGFAFTYNGLNFSQDDYHLFMGLCAYDNAKNVEATFQALQANRIKTARMGVFKPRTNPYTFQGAGVDCLPTLFELAGKYDIACITMEVTHESQIEAIDTALAQSGQATGAMLQIGTRNAQNFELLKACGAQKTYPILYKRGFGISLHESLQAAEYLALHGNPNVIFCLRGMQSHYGFPHRNFVDVAMVPTVKRLTRMPVCMDPSHSVGSNHLAPDLISEIAHVAAQATIAGANMLLVDVHPDPTNALVDAKQAMDLRALPSFIEDMQAVRACYARRLKSSQG